MRRMLMLLTVALVMAAMMILAAVPAFARVKGDCPTTGCRGGQAFDTGTGGGGSNITINPDGTYNISGGFGTRGGGSGGHCTNCLL